MFSLVQLFTAFAILSVTAANPVSNTCTPNFQGNALKIFSSNAEWSSYNSRGATVTLANFGTGYANQFLVEFTGQPANDYHIKLVANTARDLQLTAFNYGGELSFEEITSNGSQDFKIQCDRCSDSGVQGQNCIISRSNSDLCITGNYPGQTLTLTECNWSDSQRFTFVQAGW